MGERIKVTANKPLSTKENSASNKQKTGFRSQSSHVDRILFLQRTIGNQAVQRLIKSGALQAKLRIGQPGDVYEQEADRVADEVMRMPEMQRQVEPEEEEEEILQTKPLVDQITPLVQRQVEEEEEEEEMLQAKSKEDVTPEVSNDLESQINAIKGGGRPLAESERAFFEPRFGVDFGDVRLHTDALADESVRAMNARAFTLRNDIVFGEGQYSPGTIIGKRLLAHELTHVIQQRLKTGRAASKKKNINQSIKGPVLQGAWSQGNTTNFTGFDEATSGNGRATGSFLTNGVRANSRAWQSKRSREWCVRGGTASSSRWKATQYTFRHDGRDNNFLDLTVTGRIFGGAKAEDLHYAKSGAAVVGLIKVRTPTSPTPSSTRLFVIKDGGKSSAVLSTIADIEVTIPIDGTINVRIPLKGTLEGALSDFSESLVPPASPDVGGNTGSEIFVDLYLAAKVEATSDIERTCVPESFTEVNWSHATGLYNLIRWRDRSAPGTVSPEERPSGREGAAAEESTRHQVRLQLQAGTNELIPSTTITRNRPITTSEGVDGVDNLVNRARGRHRPACQVAKSRMQRTIRGYAPAGVQCPPQCADIARKWCNITVNGRRIRIDLNNDAGHNFQT